MSQLARDVARPSLPAEALLRELLPTLVESRARPDEQVEVAELARLLATETERLPDDDATFIKRCLFEGVQLQEVARALGLSKSWGSRRLARVAGVLGKRLVLAAR